MKAAQKVVALLVVVATGAMLLPFAQEWAWTMKRKRVSAQIKASYVQSASRGEVAVPVTNSDALRCSSMCFWSLPNSVEVKTRSGNTLFYIAHRTTNSDAPYTFKYITGTDTNGNQLTNAPGI
jgi:hypothetical protein